MKSKSKAKSSQCRSNNQSSLAEEFGSRISSERSCKNSNNSRKSNKNRCKNK